MGSMQEVDLLQDDNDNPDADGPALSAAPLEPAARTALLRQLPPDARPAADAAVAAAGGADVEALQSAFEVRFIVQRQVSNMTMAMCKFASLFVQQ